MRSLNRVMLIGNLGSDPELRHTPSGNAVASFNLATNEMTGGRDGQPGQERTEWHRIVLWGKLAEIANQYLRKGNKAYIEGRLQTREWTDKQGNKRYTTEIVGQQMLMLGGRGEGGGQGGGQGGASYGGRAQRSEGATPAPAVADDFGSGEAADPGRPDFIDNDDDLPF